MKAPNQTLTILFWPLRKLSGFFPKKKNVWIFGSWSGNSFSDNSKALFLYIKNNQKGIRPIWLTKNKKLLSSPPEKEMEMYYFYSFKGILYSLIARVAVMSCSWVDLPMMTFLFPEKLLLVQLWHGTPLKKMDLKKGSIIQKISRSVLIGYMGREYDIITTATDLNREIYKKVFNISEEKILTLGQPRNDLIEMGKKFRPELGYDKKKILYVPTWRSYEFKYFEYGFRAEEFDDFLRKNNAILVIKIHPNEVNKYISLTGLTNIIFWKDEDVYECLNDFDILLTDYSSLYFDYLLLQKPIIFTVFDFEKYSEQTNFYYDYNNVTPGPKTKNWDETKSIIAKMLICDKASTSTERVKKMFNKYTDFQSSSRTYKTIQKKLS